MAGVFKYQSTDYSGINDTGGEDIRYGDSSTLLSSQADTIISTDGNFKIGLSGGDFSVNSQTKLFKSNGDVITGDTSAILSDWSDQSSRISMFGGDLGDVLTGGSGDDNLNGGAGADTLTGGAGNDNFSGAAAEMDGDTITDFAAGDKIEIRGGDFSNATLNDGVLNFGSDYQLTLNGFSGTLSATFQSDMMGGYTTFTLPPVPAPSQPDLAAESDTGSSDSDNNTSNTTPTFTGTGNDGHTVRVFADTNNNATYDEGTDTLIGTQVLSGSTDYTITAESALADGDYAIHAVQTDEEDETSSATEALAVTIDTTAPTLDGDNSTPANGADQVAVDDNIAIQFNENIAFGSTGTVTLYNETSDAPALTFDVSKATDSTVTLDDGSTATITNDTLTLTPHEGLAGKTHYRVDITAGALTDTAGNAINAVGDRVYEFTTVDPDALYTNSGNFNTTDGTHIKNNQQASNADNTIFINSGMDLENSTLDGVGGTNTVVLAGTGLADFTNTSAVQNVSILEVSGSASSTVRLNQEKG